MAYKRTTSTIDPNNLYSLRLLVAAGEDFVEW